MGTSGRLLASLKRKQPALGAAIERWLAQLPDLTENGRERLLQWAGNAAAGAKPALAPWMKKAGENGDRRQAVVWVFNGCRQSGGVSPDALRILLVAAQQGKSGKAAALVLHRLRHEAEDEPQDIESLAAEIMPVALDSPHPDHVVGTIVEFLLSPNMPLMDRGTWSLLAGMTARECEANEQTAAFENEIRAQRRKAGSLRRTAHWKLLAGTEDGARKKAAERKPEPDGDERRDALLKVLEARDIDELIEACRKSLSESELQFILGVVIERLVRTRDARLSAEHRDQLGRILGKHVARQASVRATSSATSSAASSAAAAPSGGSRLTEWSQRIVRTTWMTVAHADAAREFLADHRATGRVDWGMYHDLSIASNVLDEAQRTAWSVTLGDLCRESLRRGTLEYGPFVVWIHSAPDDAARTLLQEIDLDDGTLTPTVLSTLARGYQRLASLYDSNSARSQAAIARLTSIAARADDAGATATNALEILGVASQAPVLALGAEWRTTKSPAVLKRFFQTYIQHLPEGTPFDRWQRILGRPHSRRENFLTYRAKDADRVYELYLGLDREGRLVSWQEGPR